MGRASQRRTGITSASGGWWSEDGGETLLQRSAYGVGRPVLNLDNVRKVPVLIAPVHEQRRIVEKVDETLTQLASARNRLRKVSAVLKRFRQAVLAAACSGKLTEDWRKSCGGSIQTVECDLGEFPELWRVATVGHLLTEPLANGRSVPDANTGFPVLRLTALKDGKIDITERKIGAWSRSDSRPFLVKRNDFFVARGSGSLTHVGRGGLVDVEPDAVAYPDTLIRVRVNEEINKNFLALIWSSRILRNQIEATARTTAGIFKISQRDIETFHLPIPPLEEQHEIVRRVEGLFKLAAAIEKRVAAATLRAEKLTQSILAKAFRGRLVPTEAELARREGRDYEPAWVLLERIRKEREEASEEKPKGAKKVRAVAAE